MTETRNGSESADLSEPSKQATPATRIVTQRRAAERSRRSRRWARRHLDILVGSPTDLSTAVDGGDYWHDVGMTMGWPERRAAGIALLERERVSV
jgi:hypothetical protein